MKLCSAWCMGWPAERVGWRSGSSCRWVDAIELSADPQFIDKVRDRVDDLLKVNAVFRLRAAQGVLGLAGRHSPARLEAACAKAIAWSCTGNHRARTSAPDRANSARR